MFSVGSRRSGVGSRSRQSRSAVRIVSPSRQSQSSVARALERALRDATADFDWNCRLRLTTVTDDSRLPIVDCRLRTPQSNSPAPCAAPPDALEIVYAAGRLPRQSRRVEVVDVAVGRVEEIEDVERDAHRSA